MTIATALTCAVHFVALTATRQLGAALLVGPAVGNMRLQFVGVFAYGAILPVVCLLLSRLFGGEAVGRTVALDL